MGLYAINLSVEVSAVLRSELTKYCPMLSVCDSLTLSILISNGVSLDEIKCLWLKLFTNINLMNGSFYLTQTYRLTSFAFKENRCPDLFGLNLTY